MKTIKIEYYAYFRERSGASSEEIETAAASLADLYIELADRHGFKLPVSTVKAIIGEEFVPMSSSFEDQDLVAFVPPVAGG